MSGSVKRISRARVGPVFSTSAAGVQVDQEKRAPPLSLRLSGGERAELERLAGNQSLNGYNGINIYRLGDDGIWRVARDVWTISQPLLGN